MIATIDPANIITAITGNSGTTVAPMISIEVAPVGRVSVSVVELVLFVELNWTVLPAAVTLVTLSIIAFGSVSTISPDLSNVTVTDLPSLIVAAVTFDVVDVLVMLKLLPLAVFAITVVCMDWPPPVLLLPPPPVVAATFTVPTMLGCNAQKY